MCLSEEDEGIILGRGGDLLTPALASAPLPLSTGSEPVNLQAFSLPFTS